MRQPYRTSPGAAINFQALASNTAADTIITQSVIPAGALRGDANTFTGQALLFEAFGNTDNVVTAAPVWNVWVKIGATKIATLSWTASAAARTNQFWTARFLVTCRSQGAAGTIIASGVGMSNIVTTVPGWTQSPNNVAPATTALDTTVAQTIVLGMNWGVANAANIGRCDHAYTLFLAGGVGAP